jgi:hypothetical protein
MWRFPTDDRRRAAFIFEENPHPNPLPEYRRILHPRINPRRNR